jgi:hypothetical protein
MCWALTPCRHTVSGSISLRSQRFFSPFPRGTCSLSVADLYLALCGGPHRFTLRFTCAVLLGNSLGPTRISVTGVSPSLPRLSRRFSYLCWSHDGVRTPEKYLWFGLYRFRSPLLAVSISLSFPPLTEMFHFSGYRELCPTFPTSNLSVTRGFRQRRLCITTTRLSHSEISGSTCICHSPKLIAAYHVLHRHSAPRHPLCAL